MIEKLLQVIWYVQDWWQGKPLGGARSPQWRYVRRAHLDLYPLCAVCGKKGSLLKPNEVHHCVLYSNDPTQELLPQNLITLCRDDHFIFGHLKNFKCQNDGVREDAKIWSEKIKNRQ